MGLGGNWHVFFPSESDYARTRAVRVPLLKKLVKCGTLTALVRAEFSVKYPGNMQSSPFGGFYRGNTKARSAAPILNIGSEPPISGAPEAPFAGLQLRRAHDRDLSKSIHADRVHSNHPVPSRRLIPLTPSHLACPDYLVMKRESSPSAPCKQDLCVIQSRATPESYDELILGCRPPP